MLYPRRSTSLANRPANKLGKTLRQVLLRKEHLKYNPYIFTHRRNKMRTNGDTAFLYSHKFRAVMQQYYFSLTFSYLMILVSYNVGPKVKCVVKAVFQYFHLPLP